MFSASRHGLMWTVHVSLLTSMSSAQSWAFAVESSIYSIISFIYSWDCLPFILLKWSLWQFYEYLLVSLLETCNFLSVFWLPRWSIPIAGILMRPQQAETTMIASCRLQQSKVPISRTLYTLTIIAYLCIVPIYVCNSRHPTCVYCSDQS